ncbi:MAG: aromatic amino acid transaminase, partial [Pseudomonadota bacterium]
MFEAFASPPPDQIIALMQAYKADPRADKIDLGVGVYKDATGLTPLFRAVRAAQTQAAEQEKSKAYVGVRGDGGFCDAVARLVFGAEADLSRIGSVQAVGGTGALRLLADALAKIAPERRIDAPDITWPNHFPVLTAAGFAVEPYPYFDYDAGVVSFERFEAHLAAAPSGRIVLLHGCCHNPTGADPSPEQWERVIAVVKARGLLPFVDMAYHGFADGLETDAYLPRRLLAEGLPFALSYSCSKNFGVYRDRVGVAMLIAPSADVAERAQKSLMSAARANYSMPPHHGAELVRRVLESAELRADWEAELAEVRARVNGLRDQLATALRPLAPGNRFAAISAQRGMFSYLNLAEAQTEAMRRDHGVYAVAGGRINVAG